MRKGYILGLAFLLITIISFDTYAVEWKKDEGGWKLLDNRGRLCTDQWFYDGGKQYYLDSHGYMSVGWTLIGDNWYCFEQDGTLVTDQWIDDRYVDYSGKVIKDERAKAGHKDVTGNNSTEHYVPSKPIEIKYMRAHMSKDGWISPNIYFINSSGKIINQIVFTITPYDSGHNEVACDVTGVSTVEKTVNGPFYPDNPEVCGKYIMAQDGTVVSADPSTVSDYAMTFDNCLVLDHIWFNKNISTYAIVGIRLIYQDGSSETVDPYTVIKQSY